MKIKNYAGGFSIFIGVSMLVQWVMFYFGGQIPELVTEPIRIYFHLIAEFITAVLLIAGGYGLLKSKAWGKSVYLVGTGALIYTSIVSPGYFAQKGQWLFVLMFAMILGVANALMLMWLREEK